MSRVSSRFQTNTLTVWPVISESDGYSEAVYGEPITVMCEYDQKPMVMKDDSGNEFVPEFTFYISANSAVIGGINAQGRIQIDTAVNLFWPSESQITEHGSMASGGYKSSPVKRDWFCLLGNHTDLTPPSDAKRIRAVRAQQNIGRLGGDDITVLV
mgnify:FL=1